MPTAKESVEIGREAYKEHRWKEAIDAFTDAIDNAELDDDDLYKYYSNRCACQMQLGPSGLDAALEDAEVITQLKPTWAKGWGRLGTCQTDKYMFTAAVASFEKALELDKGNAEYVKGRAKAQAQNDRIREMQARASAGAGAGGGVGGTGSSGTAAGSKRVCALLCRAGLFVAAARFFLAPTLERARLVLYYRTTLKAYLATALLNFINQHGAPQFNKAYMQRTVSDTAAQRIFGGLILMMGTNFVALLPLLLAELSSFATDVIAQLKDLGRKREALMLTSRLEARSRARRPPPPLS